MTTPDAVELALFRALPGDLSILYPSPAEDKDTVAVTAADRAEVEPQDHRAIWPRIRAEVKFGAPSEFLNRAEGLPGLKAKYGLDIAPAQLRRDQRRRRPGDGAGAASTAPSPRPTSSAPHRRSAQNNLVVLEDPKNNFLAANVVPLVSSQKKSDELKTRARCRVSAKLTTEALIELNTACRATRASTRTKRHGSG